jgi:hypothetical protein
MVALLAGSVDLAKETEETKAAKEERRKPRVHENNRPRAGPPTIPRRGPFTASHPTPLPSLAHTHAYEKANSVIFSSPIFT